MTNYCYVIGIDSGGTKIRGVLMRDNKVIKRAEVFHHVKKVTKPIFLKSLYAVLDSLFTPQIKTIGIGLPGRIRNNRVIGAGNIAALSRMDVKEIVQKKYHTRVILDNDVKVALRGEMQNLKGYASVFMLTLGTGIGGGWFLNGRIMRGSFDTAYELGQMVIDAKTQKGIEKESCGAEFFRSRGYDPIGSEERARAGNMFHKKLWEEFGENLGISLSNVINLIEPELIIIGGGLMHAWDLFIPSTKKAIKHCVLSPLARTKTKIIKAKLGKWSGAIGAGLLAKTNTP